MMRALDRKLLRDLWRIKGQAGAIAAVVAVGVLLQVMMSGMVASLDETRQTYYDRSRLAQIFAPVTRAPEHVLHRLSAIEGVGAVEGRITGGALLDMEGQDLPVRAQAVSLPQIGAPKLNDVHLSAGRLLAPGRTDEVLLLKSFADAHEIPLGAQLSATMNGARRTFTVVGIAQSPEFLVAVAPGELVPDVTRFAVLWMNEDAMAAAFDMKGAFNEALLSLERGAELEPVLAAADRELAQFGGLGAYGLKDHMSNRFISDEIDGLRSTSAAVPPIFMGVAAFLLYIVVTRLVQAEREQIGLIKAFGYTDLEVSVHYFKLVVLIALLGALMGCVLGIWAGRSMVGVYQANFHFPFLVFRVDPAAFVSGVTVSVLSASAGGIFVLRRVFTLTPAVAMRPPAPADFSRSGALNVRLKRWLDQPSRMVLRRVIRSPGRIAGSVIGISVGMALSAAMITLLSGFDESLDLTFGVIDRSDMQVSFYQPMSGKTVFELQQLPGVIEVEPTRAVSAVLRNGLYTYRGGITGLAEGARLNRAVDKDVQAIDLPEQGVVLAKSLADLLQIKSGEMLTVEVLEGRRPVLTLPVASIAETLMGAPAFMRIETLNRALREPDRVSGAYLRVDANALPQIFDKVKGMPMVAGVSRQTDAREAMQKMMDEGAGAMRFVMVGIAAIITFGIVYNAARISYGEQSRDLASLRVIGFSNSETAFVLLGELALVVLMAIPLGIGLGYALGFLVAAGFSTELYQIPAGFRPVAHGQAAAAVVVASLVSGWLVKRDIQKVDLVETLKTRE
ncbi:ABC transporter permease [Shimia biformata]|uniref:ABC transporter permease n=1 Tax=Shimia biformata TaxID=1294299 RepID=UPI0019504073|nr:ABC transporter permease [Shimia biformata]